MIIDASSLLNLHSGALMPTILTLRDVSLSFGPQVRQECRSIARELDEMLMRGAVALLDDDKLPFGRFVELSANYQLGPGEIQCLAFAESLGCSVVCDDSRARKMIAREIGIERVTGTIGLIQAAVDEGVLSTSQAHAAHSQMKANGAFLPALSLPMVVSRSARR